MDERVDAALSLPDLSSIACFDGIFLCRSGSWVPPHLDGYFLELASLLVQPDGGWECCIQTGILEHRFDEDFERDVVNLSQFYHQAVTRREPRR